MNKWIKNLSAIAATTVLAATMLSTPAHAKIKEIKFHFVEGQLNNPPALVMKHNGGKWKWINKSDTYNTHVKIKIRANGYRVKSGDLKLYSMNKSAYVKGVWEWPLGYKAYKYEKLIPVHINGGNLSHYSGNAATLCDTFGGTKKVIRTMNAPATLRAIATSGGYSYRKGSLPIKVVCMPKTEPTRKPVDLKITNLKVFTVPAKPVCGKPVSLVAKFTTNKKGKINFHLVRHDNAKQAQSVTIHKVGNGYGVSWSKKYTFNKSTSRKYKIIASSPFAQSAWVPLKVSCGANADANGATNLAN
ncbi:MAG: hypothetical protein AAF478_06410 [Pseudomonadota bacterium]